MKKQGVYRKSTKIELLKDYSRLSAGSVVEVHPVLADRLIALEVAKKTTKALTNNMELPSARIVQHDEVKS